MWLNFGYRTKLYPHDWHRRNVIFMCFHWTRLYIPQCVRRRQDKIVNWQLKLLYCNNRFYFNRCFSWVVLPLPTSWCNSFFLYLAMHLCVLWISELSCYPGEFVWCLWVQGYKPVEQKIKRPKQQYPFFRLGIFIQLHIEQPIHIDNFKHVDMLDASASGFNRDC